MHILCCDTPSLSTKIAVAVAAALCTVRCCCRPIDRNVCVCVMAEPTRDTRYDFSCFDAISGVETAIPVTLEIPPEVLRSVKQVISCGKLLFGCKRIEEGCTNSIGCRC